jgi:hypothetical protein
MATKRLKRPRDPVSLAKLIGDIALKLTHYPIPSQVYITWTAQDRRLPFMAGCAWLPTLHSSGGVMPRPSAVARLVILSPVILVLSGAYLFAKAMEVLSDKATRIKPTLRAGSRANKSPT